MTNANTNAKLAKARKSKNDEFYTQLSDIENELKHYSEHFRNKVVYCNCDDPKSSNFYRYFVNNFEILKLKTLLCTHYQPQQQNLFGTKKIMPATCTAMYARHRTVKHDLAGDGDFRSEECKTILDTADIVVTNPPFSLFREYVDQLIKYEKEFIILGSINNIAYRNILTLFINRQIQCGFNAGNMGFQTDKNVEESSFGNICWFTNLPKRTQPEFFECTKKYNPKDYPQYDNYNAVNVNKIKDIPIDYKGLMGVPITFLTNYNPGQFEVIDAISRSSLLYGPVKETRGKYITEINKKRTYARIIIKHKK